MTVFFICSTAKAACPRFPFPKTPDQIWQNDQDLDDCISNLSTGTASVSFSTSSIGAYISSVNVSNALSVTPNGTGGAVITISANTSSTTLLGNGNIAFPGRTTNAFQPSFSAYNSSIDSDVTGDGTLVTVDFDTEVFDLTNNFSGDIFTAPVTGHYLLQAKVSLKDTGGAACEGRLVTTNRTYASQSENNAAIFRDFDFSVIADMTAGDTAIVQVICSGGAKVDDILGTGATTTTVGNPTYFSGTLLN